MNLELISLTQAGSALAAKIASQLSAQGHVCAVSAPARYAAPHGILPLGLPVEQWAQRAFSSAQGLIFVCATGIAVRSIAPHIDSKLTDPAVICIDEQGRFVVPLLSGHVGGANALAREIAGMIGAVPVISTATDLNGIFAVDEWAARSGMTIADKHMIKEISAALLDGRPVGLVSDFPIDGDLPPGVQTACEPEAGICVSLNSGAQPFAKTLHLIPRVVTLGIGCRRGTDARTLEQIALRVLREHNIDARALAQVASIEQKADEPAILAFCKKYALPFDTYTAKELGEVPGEFAESEFVHETVGVGNVCERAALFNNERLIVRKHAEDGVTIAAALKKYTLRFS